MFSSFDLSIGTIEFVLVFRWSAVDWVLDLLALFVLNDSIFALFCADIPAVPVDGVFLTGE